MHRENHSHAITTAVGIAAGVVLLLFQPLDARAQIPFEPLQKTNRTSVGGPSTKLELVTSEQELATAWAEMGRHDPLPSFDFRQHSAIFYFAGWKQNTGYSDDIERIQIRRGVMEVDVVESIPGNGCGTGQLATAPSVAVLTIPWKGVVEPIVRTVVHECNY